MIRMVGAVLLAAGSCALGLSAVGHLEGRVRDLRDRRDQRGLRAGGYRERRAGVESAHGRDVKGELRYDQRRNI